MCLFSGSISITRLLFYHLIAVIVFVVAWIMWRVVHSPLGSVLAAIRENENRARFIGYPVLRYKLAAFVISATVTGLGGSLMAFLKLFVSADTVHVNFSGEILAMTIFGGVGSFLGPTLGAFFYIMFREVLTGYTSAWQFWFGLLFMAFILFSPSGLVGVGARLLAPLRRKTGRRRRDGRARHPAAGSGDPGVSCANIRRFPERS